MSEIKTPFDIVIKMSESGGANQSIIGAENKDMFSSDSVIYNSVTMLPTNSGWNRVDMYFNTGDASAVRLFIYYISQNVGEDSEYIFIDNLFCHRYQAGTEVINGDFEEGTKKWYGDSAVTTDANNKVL